jgi:hypothetical protein
MALLAGLLSVAAPAYAAEGESITSYDTRLDVQANGQILVTETIRYDFGTNQRHGIIRRIPVRTHYDAAHDRLYRIEGFAASRDGASESVSHLSGDRDEQFTIGDPARQISGVHTYVIAYTVEGALDGSAEGVELRWNAVGDQWDVPIASTTGTVSAPAAVTHASCLAGPDSVSCESTVVSGRTVAFSHGPLPARAGVSVVIGLPAGSVAGAGPILARRGDLAYAFQAAPWTVGGGIAVALLAIGGALAVAWRVGRDRRYVGTLPGLLPEYGGLVVEQRRPLAGKPPVSVEFSPPYHIRPGQAGALLVERAETLHVTATIIDLAVRGHLHIRQLEPGELPSKLADWELTRLTDGDPTFLPYERTLFGALFYGRDRVRLSDLRYVMAGDLNLVRQQLGDDLVTQGWYRRRPDETRKWGRRIGVLALIGAIVAAGVLAYFGLGLVGLGLVAGAIALLVAARDFPARTAVGSAVLERVRGFRLYVATVEAPQIPFQEREQIFTAYLPYAIAFGLGERWASVFGELAATVVPWYTGADGGGWGGSGVSAGEFTAAAAWSLAESGASGGGGDGGSSGGGGGGSSW